MSIFCVEWLCSQERWNSEATIMFSAATRYLRATAGSSHDDAHSNTGFAGSLFITSPRTGQGSSQVSEVLPDFSCISWACAFGAGIDASVSFSGPVEADERHNCSVSTGWLFRNLMAHPILSFVKQTVRRHRSGFEPQRESPFGKRVKVPQVVGEAARARTMVPLFALPFTLLVVLASSTSGHRHVCIRYAV
jgi:hypothetical protein